MPVALSVRPPVIAPASAPLEAPRAVPINAPTVAAAGAPSAAPVARDSEGGLFFKAVLRGFARLSHGDGADDGTRVVAQQKVKIELEIDDDGDFSLAIDVKSKLRVHGADADDALRTAGDFMRALQAFTAELFSTLQGLFAPPTAVAALAAGAAAADATAPAAAAGPAPMAAATPEAATASTLPRLRLQAAYVSMEMRVSLLADQVRRAERGDDQPGSTRNAGLTGLGQRFELLAAALRPQGVPTLSDFLRTLLGPAAADTAVALPLRAAGGFVSTQA